MKYLSFIFLLAIISCGWQNESIPTIPESNNTPIIESLTTLHDSIYIGYSTTILCDAIDADGDQLNYKWIYNGGTISGTGYKVEWNAPNREGKYSIKCRVDDGKGKSISASVSVYVDFPNPPTASISLPQNNSIYTKPNPIISQFTYSDTDGDVDSLMIFIDDNYFRSLKDGETDLIIDSEILEAGDHTIYGEAVDNHGAKGRSEEITFLLKNKKLPIDFMPIPRGSFLMGSDSYEINEKPIHFVSLSRDFYMSKTEITNSQFVDVINFALENSFIEVPNNLGIIKNIVGESKPLYKINHSLYMEGGVFVVKAGFENFPVSNVSWYGAAFFCNMLSLMEGKNTLYNLSDWSCNTYTASSGGYRLPTEAEWEYSSVMPDGRLYSWGDYIDNNYSVYDSNSPQEVLSKYPMDRSHFSLSGMNGNVSEWINDGYGNYLDEVQTNPTGSGNMSIKVLRGGDFSSSAINIRNRFRTFGDSETLSEKYGFRIVHFIP
ncbi:MAG: hypothetical protein CR982_03720 [Candidatus Cloacimonadota bacterium]|nr:MAG: hypothetical protein CR982_03720 [Candidatus Cloacimonadota bacterium]PIE79360.1 MAG: hypothetical protein CSA15_03370 [Candidatus Delongbacteria bacterium]